MLNTDSLFQTISQTLSNAPQERANFTTLDLQYACSQLNLQADTAIHCNQAQWSEKNHSNLNLSRTTLWKL